MKAERWPIASRSLYQRDSRIGTPVEVVAPAWARSCSNFARGHHGCGKMNSPGKPVPDRKSLTSRGLANRLDLLSVIRHTENGSRQNLDMRGCWHTSSCRVTASREHLGVASCVLWQNVPPQSIFRAAHQATCADRLPFIGRKPCQNSFLNYRLNNSQPPRSSEREVYWLLVAKCAATTTIKMLCGCWNAIPRKHRTGGTC